MAVLSTGSGHMARSLDVGCGWPISYCPVQAVYQQPGRAIFSKGWESEWPLYQSRSGDGIKADGRFTKAGKPQWPFYQQCPLYQGLAILSSAMAALSRPMAALSRPYKATVAALSKLKSRSGRFINRKWPHGQSLDLGCGWPISYCPVQAVYQRPELVLARAGEANGRFIKAGQPQWPLR